jgi:hypothetical protein
MRSPIALILILCLPLALATPNASGQTTPPTATPLPPPTATVTPAPLPSGPALLARADAADLAKDTMHVEGFRQDLTPGKVTTLAREHADAAWREQRLHVIITSRSTRLDVHPPSVTTSRMAWIVVGNRSATRTNRGAWTCGKSTSATVDGNGGANAPKPVTQGSETLDGTPVWRVRTIYTLNDNGSVTHETVDDYISQLDYTWVREVISGTVLKQGTLTDRFQGRSDFSRYGAPVHVRLPAACRGRAGSGIGTSPTGLRSWMLQRLASLDRAGQ